MHREDAGTGGYFRAVAEDESADFSIGDIGALRDGAASADVHVVGAEHINEGIDKCVAAVFDAGQRFSANRN